MLEFIRDIDNVSTIVEQQTGGNEMKIMTEPVYSNLIRKVSENYPDRKVYSYWKSWKKHIKDI